MLVKVQVLLIIGILCCNDVEEKTVRVEVCNCSVKKWYEIRGTGKGSC